MSKFEVKQRIDEVIYRSYNSIMDFIFAFSTSSRAVLSNNRRYHNIHQGDACFILGTGPSLANLSLMEIERLRNSVVIGVNSLYKSDMGGAIIPKYYALMDNLYWTDWSKTFGDIAEKYIDNPPIFISDIRAKGFVDSLTTDVEAIYLYTKKYPVDRVSDKIDGNVYAVMNVVSYSILVAMYMGFNKIYLLGCDFNAFCSAGKGHCYDDEVEISQSNYNLAFYLKHYLMITEFHYLISKLAKARKIDICNATPGSLLDAYPRIGIKQALGIN